MVQGAGVSACRQCGDGQDECFVQSYAGCDKCRPETRGAPQQTFVVGSGAEPRSVAPPGPPEEEPRRKAFS